MDTVRPGPALVSGAWHDFWIYLAGPLIGAAVGVFAYQLVRGPHPGTTADSSTERETVDGKRPVRLSA